MTSTAKLSKKITIDGKEYRRFIPYPASVTDGTVRCITCGQIDEPPHHDDDLCHAALRAPPPKTGLSGAQRSELSQSAQDEPIPPPPTEGEVK